MVLVQVDAAGLGRDVGRYLGQVRLGPEEPAVKDPLIPAEGVRAHQQHCKNRPWISTDQIHEVLNNLEPK